MNRKIELWLSAPKSFYASWKLTSFKQAFSLPVVVRYNTILRDLSGHLESPKIGNQKAILFVGFNCGEGTADTSIRSVLEIKGTIKIQDLCRLGVGSRVQVAKDAIWEMESFMNSSRFHIICEKQIKMGKGFKAGWETTIIDSDMHPIIHLESGKISEPAKAITFGDNVWMGTQSTVLKGSKVPSGCIICAKALVNQRFRHENAVIMGNPAQELMTGYTFYDW